MIMYMNFQFAAARKHKFLLIHGQRSKEDQRWRLNKSRVQRYISYQDLPGSSDWSDNIGGFPYRFHHHWILMNFVLGQHGGRLVAFSRNWPSNCAFAGNNHLFWLEQGCQSDVFVFIDNCRYSTMQKYDIPCILLTFVLLHLIIPKQNLYTIFFSSAGYLATSKLYSFVVLSWPQALLIWNAADLCFWVWLRSASFYSFCLYRIWCTQVLCLIVFGQYSNQQAYLWHMYGLLWTYNWARHSSSRCAMRSCVFCPGHKWLVSLAVYFFPQEMLYPKNCSWIPWIHCALLKQYRKRLWVFPLPQKTLFLSICNLETRY